MGAYVKFWGTRGSIPTPGSWTRVYGGNTSCVEIRFDDTLFICDAGSGIRELGKDLLERDPIPRDVHLFITHTHWDHIQGFPFFAPAHAQDFKIHLYDIAGNGSSRHSLISGQMTSSYFPVNFGDLQAGIESKSIENGEIMINGVKVSCFPTNHPGGCYGYSFEKDGKKVSYVTDNEISLTHDDTFPDTENKGRLRVMPEALLQSVIDSDLLIIDAQYDEHEYAQKVGWGHSSSFSATDLGIQAGVQAVALFHHDPECSDEEVDNKVETCRNRAAAYGAELIIFAAREGVELKL